MRVISRRILYFSFLVGAGLSLAAPSALASSRVRRNVEVDWEPVPGASEYEVQIVRKDDRSKKPTRLKTHEPHWSAVVKPGLYLFQLRSYDERGVPGEWSPPSDLQVKLPSVVMTSPMPGDAIDAEEDDKHEVKFEWEEVPGAHSYKLDVRSTTSTWQVEKEVSDTEFKLDVPVGEKLEWNVTAIDAKDEVGDTNALPQSFETKGPPLPSPDVTKPLSKYVEDMEWAPVPNAKNYNYELDYKDPKSKKWQKIEAKADVTEPKIKWDIKRPSGKYRLKVQARGERRKPSKVATLEFETRGGFRDPASLQTAILRDSITKPTNFYGIASYLITDVSYQSANYDSNQTATFNAVGGTGRIGMGYQDPDSKWGGFGIADLSGFTIQGQTFTFASAEGHLTHKLEFGQGGLLLFGTGLFMKELPIVNGSTTLGFRGLGKVRQIGPHAGFTYWIPITQRLGLQANARLYYTLLGSSAPGPSLKPTMSYQYGLMGSYRLNQAWMGYAGYAFRKDQAEYGVSPGGNSDASPGEINTINIQGNYLNLILEYSF